MRMNRKHEVPAVFRGGCDYRFEPSALESAQATFNEELLYVGLVNEARRWYRRTRRAARVIDLCAASGLTAMRIAEAIPVSSITLVDFEPSATAAAITRFGGRGSVAVHCADAVTFNDGREYDLVLMNSAYHHIENQRKEAFMANAERMLVADGCILVGDHFLAPYDDHATFRRSVVAFYAPLLEELERRGEPAPAINVIRKAGYYTWLGEYEYKTSWEYARRCIPVKLSVASSARVWAPASAPPAVGSTVLRLERYGDGHQIHRGAG